MSATITRSDQIKSLGLAFVLVLAASVVIFLVLSKFGVEDQIAGPISGSLFTAITYVAQILDKGKSGKGISLLPDGVVDYTQFSIPFYLMFFYCLIILSAAMQISSLIGGIVAGIAHVNLPSILPVIAGFSLVINLAAAFFVGSWIGKRCAKYLVITVISVCIFAAAIGHSIDFLTLSNDSFEQVYHSVKTLDLYLAEIALGSVLFSLAGLTGCWIGFHLRKSAYLNYLLKRVPPQTRDILLRLTFEEASKLHHQV